MDSTIRETLRVHAPIHSIFRKVISDIPVPPSVSSPSESGTYVIPKGYYVLASPGVAQMDGRIWDDAGRWEPSRWTDKSGVAAKAGDAYDNDEADKVDYGFGGSCPPSFLPSFLSFCPLLSLSLSLQRLTPSPSSSTAISKGTESPYQPFGAGRHRCIGESFAYVQLSTILACFVQKMELKLEGGVPETNYEVRAVVVPSCRSLVMSSLAREFADTSVPGLSLLSCTVDDRPAQAPGRDHVPPSGLEARLSESSESRACSCQGSERKGRKRDHRLVGGGRGRRAWRSGREGGADLTVAETETIYPLL